VKHEKVSKPSPPFTWTGFYVGGNLGGAWANGTLTDTFSGVSFGTGHSGFIGGGQLGYNYQIGRLVLGAAGDFDWTSLNETSHSVVTRFGTLEASADTLWVTTLAARVGVAADKWLLYVKGGGGWVHNTASIADLTTGATASINNTNGGWLVG